MKVFIKEVKALKNGDYGDFILRERSVGLIRISMALNRLLCEYGATLLHELLHLWVAAMRLKGYKVSDRKEHKFVYAAEARIISLAKRYLGVVKCVRLK